MYLGVRLDSRALVDLPSQIVGGQQVTRRQRAGHLAGVLLGLVILVPIVPTPAAAQEPGLSCDVARHRAANIRAQYRRLDQSIRRLVTRRANIRAQQQRVLNSLRRERQRVRTVRRRDPGARINAELVARLERNFDTLEARRLSTNQEILRLRRDGYHLWERQRQLLRGCQGQRGRGGGVARAEPVDPEEGRRAAMSLRERAAREAVAFACEYAVDRGLAYGIRWLVRAVGIVGWQGVVVRVVGDVLLELLVDPFVDQMCEEIAGVR